MNEENNAGDSFERQMFKGDWKCVECDKEITELPFQPKEGQELHCKECYISKREKSGGSSKRSFDRPMVQGDWQCSDCNKEITELPFKPVDGRPIYCRDCYRNNSNR